MFSEYRTKCLSPQAYLNTDGIKVTLGIIICFQVTYYISHDFKCKETDNCCNEADHKSNIEVYYAEIIHCLTKAAQASVPRNPRASLKHYWSIALDELEQASCSAHSIWLAAGKPRFGHIHDMKKVAHYKYKSAVRDAVTLFEHKFTDDLLDLYLQKDFKNFWEIWQKKYHRGMLLLFHIEVCPCLSQLLSQMYPKYLCHP
jgi:hypothetical protein